MALTTKDDNTATAGEAAAKTRPAPGDGRVIGDPTARRGIGEERFIEETRDLRRIVADALDFRPRRYVRSIFGPVLSWLPPHRSMSEFRIVSPFRLWRTVNYLLDVGIPSILRRPPASAAPTLFLNPTEILHQPDPGGRFDSFPDETWLFINGIATNGALARINARCLASLFRRPITLIHNATDSVGVDLIECAIGKGWEVMSRPARRAYQVLLEALDDPSKKRVVVLCHSQGTIIMANALRALQSPRARARLFAPKAGEGVEPREIRPPDPVSKTHLGKLEIYAFANCADRMLHDGEMLARGVRVPWIESFGNEYDLVARLGMLAPNKARHGIEIHGRSYVRPGKWGHYLNQHYLFEIEDHLRAGGVSPGSYLPLEEDGGGPPRLYGYFGGRVPDPY